VVAWDVAEVESAEIAAELVQRACLKERYCRPRGFGSRQSHQQPLILHSDNGNAMRAATLESRLDELGVLRSFSRPRVSNDNPYSESLFHTLNDRPDYPQAAIPERGRGLQLGSSIRFVSPSQRHCGKAIEICRHRARVYELARQRNPLRWSGTTRC
jgi:transposase InsO family protein